ncbi:RloB family protein [Streptomyces sp. NPDC047972]|uniref:RloB family protein n=1 Tax=Streptomyces sp. NPDC047972 TaxID=3365493 RepID=UPI00371BECDD
MSTNRRQLRGSQRINKPKGQRQEYRKILIVAEGEKTEPQYFEKFAALLKAKAVRVVRVDPIGLGKDPLTVVLDAEKRRNKERRAGDAFDQVWCVVDVDEHASLERACIEARRLGIEIAVSSPCFEIWLLWHFQERTAWVDAATLARELKNRGFSGKNMPADFPYTNYAAAIDRANKCEKVRIKHAPPNPSSSVASLISVLVQAYTEPGKT